MVLILNVVYARGRKVSEVFFFLICFALKTIAFSVRCGVRLLPVVIVRDVVHRLLILLLGHLLGGVLCGVLNRSSRLLVILSILLLKVILILIFVSFLRRSLVSWEIVEVKHWHTFRPYRG